MSSNQKTIYKLGTEIHKILYKLHTHVVPTVTFIVYVFTEQIINSDHRYFIRITASRF